MPLERLNLPAVLRAVAELADAATAYRPEDHPEILAAQANPETAEAPSVEAQICWHDSLDAISDAANRLKRALGATGELRPGRVRASKVPAAWLNFDSRFVDLDYPPSVRVGLYRLAVAAVDLSGFAVLKQPPEPWRATAIRFLGEGVRQIWGALSAPERDEVSELLSGFRHHFQWAGAPGAPPPAWAGPAEIAPEDEYRMFAPTDGFYRQHPEQLNDLATFLARCVVREDVAAPNPDPSDQRPAPTGSSSDAPPNAEAIDPQKARGAEMAALLRVFTNGLADERISRAARVLSDTGLTANEKLTQIDELIKFPPTASAEQLGALVGVSKQAVLKTDWWKNNRKGERESEIGRRRAAHRIRAEGYEPPDADEGDTR